MKTHERFMYKIYIDATKRYEKEVRLVKTDGDEKNETLISKASGDLDIVSTINRILNENKLTPSQIDEFVPNTGPGSFTGIKIGVTIANTLGWALGKLQINNLYKPYYGREPNISKRKEKKAL